MRAVMEADRRLEATGASPFEALRVLRQAMTRDEQLSALSWQLNEPTEARRAQPAPRVGQAQDADFALDLTLDLGRGADPAAAVAATAGLADRLTGAFPDRSVAIVRQAIDILPQQAFVGSAGLDAPGDPDARLSAELHIGARVP